MRQAVTTTRIYLVVFVILLSIGLLLWVFQADIKRRHQLDINRMSIEKKIGQMLLVGFSGSSINDAEEGVKLIKEGKVGGLILFDYDVRTRSSKRNIISVLQIKKFIADLKRLSSIPLLVGTDQEGGIIRRLKEKHGFLPTISHAKLGEMDNPSITLQASAAIAGSLNFVGFNLNFAPVVDLNSNPSNPVIAKYERSFSADPYKVYEQANAYIEGHNFFKVATAVKHFPGHGSSTSDSHLGLTDVTNTWTEQELFPYQKLIKEGSADIIMTGHIFNSKLDDKYPATLSKKIITDLLRNKLSFFGVVISDDMNMKAITDSFSLEEAIYRSINAGVDILLFGDNSSHDRNIVKKATDLIKEMVIDGRLTKSRIDQSVSRILRLKTKLGIVDQAK